VLILCSVLTPVLGGDLFAGAGSGIGVETARALSSKGAHTVLAVRNMQAGEETKADILRGSPKAQVRRNSSSISLNEPTTEYLVSRLFFCS
jgi:WW domain-containing oxidoreductase